MKNEKEIEANEPAEAVDPIEAIKDKILNAVREVPLITNQVGWNALLNSGIISLDEIIAFTNHLSKPTSPPQQTGATAGGGSTDSTSSIADNLARVMRGANKINSASGVTDFEDMRTAFYLGMGRLKASSSTTRLSHLWETARHSTENHDGIVTGTKGQLQVKSDAPVEFTCLYDCEKTDLAILGCENISNTDLHIHEFGSLLYAGENLKLAGFGQSLERANPFVPSVKSVNVALTNCSIFDSEESAEHAGWRSLKFFVVDQVVDFGYSGSPVYYPANGDVIGMLCGRVEEEFANASMCLKANYIGDALVDNFVLKRKRTFSCSKMF